MSRNKRIILIAALTIIVALAFWEIGTWLVFGAAISPYPTSCTIGITGTAANVTLSGVGADQACSKVVEQYQNKVYQVSSGNLQGSELCEGDISHGPLKLHYLVRDAGILNLVGNYICTHLTNGTISLDARLEATPTPVAAQATVNIRDGAGVLDANSVRDETSKLPVKEVDISTTNNFQGTSSDFDQEARESIPNADAIVIAIGTNIGHLSIVGGRVVNLRTLDYQNAVNAFIASYESDHNYTSATIASIDSLKSSLK